MEIRTTLLSALDQPALDRLRPEQVRLEAGQQLQSSHASTHALFPTDGLIAIVGLTAEGQTLELASVSNTGVLGLRPLCGLPPARQAALVLVGGGAVRIRAELVAQEFASNPAFRAVILSFGAAALDETTQRLLCSRFHPVLERTCRWLLATADRLGSVDIPITQDTIAQLIGVPRTTVTRAMVLLQDVEALSCRHGRIRLLDRRRIECSSCECYVRRAGPGAHLGANTDRHA